MRDAGIDLIGAVRLPKNAFVKSASTEVVTDVLVFRKRFPDEPVPNNAWTRTAQIDVEGAKARVSQYFIDHPENVIGEHSMQGSMYGGKEEYTVNPRPGMSTEDVAIAARQALRNIAEKAPKFGAETSGICFSPQDVEAPHTLKDGSFFVHGDKIMQQGPGGATEAEIPKSKIGLAKDFVRLRDLARRCWRNSASSGRAMARHRQPIPGRVE